MYKGEIRDTLLELLNESINFWERWKINVKPNYVRKWIKEEIQELQAEIDLIGTTDFDILRTAQEAADVIVVIYAGVYARKGPEITRQWAFDVARLFADSFESQDIEALKTMKLPPIVFDESEKRCKQAIHLAFSVLRAIPDTYIEQGLKNTIEKNRNKTELTHELRSFVDEETGETLFKVMRKPVVVPKKDPDSDTIIEETEATVPLTLVDRLLNGKKKSK